MYVTLHITYGRLLGSGSLDGTSRRYTATEDLYFSSPFLPFPPSLAAELMRYAVEKTEYPYPPSK